MIDYSFDIVPENTLRVTITPLDGDGDGDFAIARLLDIDEVSDELKEKTLYRFFIAIKDMGFTVLATKTVTLLELEPSIQDDVLDVLKQTKPPALLIKKPELEYDPDRF